MFRAFPRGSGAGCGTARQPFAKLAHRGSSTPSTELRNLAGLRQQGPSLRLSGTTGSTPSPGAQSRSASVQFPPLRLLTAVGGLCPNKHVSTDPPSKKLKIAKIRQRIRSTSRSSVDALRKNLHMTPNYVPRVHSSVGLRSAGPWFKSTCVGLVWKHEIRTEGARPRSKKKED